VKTTELDEIIARDSAGRIRFEKHFVLPGDDETTTLTTREGGKIIVTNGLLKMSISIFDCSKGQIINLQPGMQIAWFKEFQTGSVAKQGDYRYSFLFPGFSTESPHRRLSQRTLDSKISMALGRKA
jgi:hypothetical protein